MKIKQTKLFVLLYIGVLMIGLWAAKQKGYAQTYPDRYSQAPVIIAKGCMLDAKQWYRDNFGLEEEGVAYTYTVADSNIASLDEAGILTGNNQGATELAIHINYEEDEETLRIPVTVTDPSLEMARVILRKNENISLPLLGITEGSNISIALKGTKCNMYSWNGQLEINGKATGAETVKITVDGKVLSLVVRVINPYFKTESLNLSKGASKQVKIYGYYDKKKTVKWKSSDKKIATVKNGLVKGKREGIALITATVEGMELEMRVCVIKKSINKSLSRARSIVKTSEYSQDKRMKKGYYDCSSLVWRALKPAGFDFGSKYWAPTAADMAKYARKHYKVIAKKPVKNMDKLLPGDVFFYGGTKNGRYLGIFHTAIYGGYGTMIDHGNIAEYYYNRADTVLVVRPIKVN
ncbi:MAG: Ig-like domain-containing protein [Lachnospiraceae bacterium]|nr:Ig-like domain-containing protein [Lachnospiraceae bacterium]